MRWLKIQVVWILLAAVLLTPGHALANQLTRPNPDWKMWQVPQPGSLSAGAAVVMDARTGQVLFDKDAHRPRDPASTTKVLTALIALERGNLSDQVMVSAKAANTPGSAMHLKSGQVYSLHDLLHGLLLRSGNDAAAAIAEHLAGSVEQFARLMNEKAAALGAKNSQFKNPHGLTEQGHVSTAYDLALIARTALQNPTFAGIVAQRTVALTYESLNRDVVLHNTNQLLHRFEGANGVKTGTTAAAGRCLIASATRDGHSLIAVVLHAGNRWGDSAKLLEWGFGNFRLAYLGREGEVVNEAAVRGGKARSVPLRLGGDLVVVHPVKAPPPTLALEGLSEVAAPVTEGQHMGRAVAVVGDAAAASVPLLAGREVPKATILDRILQWLIPLVRWTGA